VTVTEERDLYLGMLRKTLKRYGQPLAADVAEWWAKEQAAIAQREAQDAARRATQIADLTAKIDELTARRAALL
jgi:hypothetical protein